MFLAIAVLLIQPQIAPKFSFSAENIALIEPVDSATMTAAVARPAPLTPDPAVTDTTVQPAAEISMAPLPDAPAPSVDAALPAALLLSKPSRPMTVSVKELAAEYRRNKLIWNGLAIASHSAATFDAWSTRHAITTQGAQELDPLLKPFAGNASLYLAIQVGPALMDYAGRKMMYSRHSWVRHMWWVPQSASFASSIFCGAHNVSFH